MSYLYDRRKKSSYRFVWIFIILFLALFTSAYAWLFDLIERPFARAWENKQEFFDGSENFLGIFYGKTRLVEKNKELEKQIQRLEVDNLRTQYLAHTLEDLYQLKEQDKNMLVVPVLSHGTLGQADTLIARHNNQDIPEPGDLVFAESYVALGLVDEVYDHTLRVRLFSYNDQSLSGILFPHDISITLQGHGKGSFMAEMSRDIDVTEGDLVYSLQNPGSLVAVVRNIEFDPRDPFKKVYLSYPMNISDIHHVGIQKQTPHSSE